MTTTSTDDFLSNYNRQWAELNAADAAAKAAGKVVGRYITHPFADGAAVYRITGEAGRSHVTVEVVEIGDAWVLPAWGRKAKLTRHNVLRFLDQRDRMDALFGRTDDWWRQQPLGRVVHYRKGHGSYVRGVIVEADGERKMKPTALVGRWAEYELPRRCADGSVYLGNYARQITDGKTMQPNASNIVEYKPQPEDPVANIATLPAIDLTVPPMTPEQQALANAWQRRGRLIAILNTCTEGVDMTDLAAATRAINEALGEVRAILNREAS